MSKRKIRVARNCSNKAGRKNFNNGNLAVAALMDAIEKENDFAMIAYLAYFTPSMEGGRIFICPECRADEEYRAKTGSRLPYMEWMLIQCAKEYVSDCA